VNLAPRVPWATAGAALELPAWVTIECDDQGVPILRADGTLTVLAWPVDAGGRLDVRAAQERGPVQRVWTATAEQLAELRQLEELGWPLAKHDVLVDREGGLLPCRRRLATELGPC